MRIADVTAAGDIRTLDFTQGANDAALKNAQMTVTINGEVVLKDFAVSEALDNLTTRDAGFIPFDVLMTWPGQTSMSIRIDAADGQTFTANLNAKLVLLGIGLQG